ncbi:putative mads box protein [Corchorus olitorius]|uniref:Mads box protein n=1 Tax=Corchorus olitorius TaxID=93759 RepID=A0A1R3KI65_9ROSI|nr:putative mads box protein [Corchorus olitorius]
MAMATQNQKQASNNTKILDCYLSGVSEPVLNEDDDDHDSATADHNIPCFKKSDDKCHETWKKLKEEKQQSQKIQQDKEKRENMGEFWWDEPIDNMTIEELEAYVKAIDELRNNVDKRAKDVMTMVANNPNPLGKDFSALNHYGF